MSDPSGPAAPGAGRPASRRDVLRALGVGLAGLPLAACATAPRPETPVVRIVSPRTPLPPIVPASPDTLVAQADTVVADSARAAVPAVRETLRPRRIRPAGTIGLVAPAGVLRSVGQVEDAVADMRAMGFETRVGRHALDRFGFLAGSDQNRADDFMAMVTDPDVDAVVCLRGGYGCARILPLLDYDAIRAAAKPVIGYSDVTALLLAIYAKSGLVSFHGPVGISSWTGTTATAFRDVLVRGETLSVEGETDRDRITTETVRRGAAEGPLVGGNLSVVASLAGTGYLPDFDGHVAFFEETGEESYRLDRLFTQLEMAGVLRAPAAVVFGQCSQCSDGGSAWTAEEVLRDHLGSYRCPAWIGAPVGHVSPVYTLPVGLRVRTDADAGTLEAVGPAVV
ncbi:MAG TPA: LD-carboxypeptidase [Rubricoccaceae bacterium]|jgi:muramoyltetrapeptide carboxypeptidase